MNYYDEIKKTFIERKTRVVIDNYTNNNDLNDCYYVGKLLGDARKHSGANIIKEHSKN